MKTFALLLLTTAFTIHASELYDLKLKTATKEEIKLDSFKNRPILFVNIATQCGYTGQLDGLEKVYKKYKEKGLVVIGVPSNDFGGQTPESNAEVAKFCKLRYGVTFPLTEKTKVVGEKKSELYRFLLSKSKNKEIEWNFTKFLFNKKGQLVNRYSSSVDPMDKSLTKDIESSL